MANPFILKKGKSQLADLLGGANALGLGVGNVYHVVQAANSYVYAHVQKNYAGKHKDGTAAVHVTIQSALDATVANRNDYVIVWPDSSDYDSTATITMSKRDVHLICPAGLGSEGFPPNAARVHQTTAATACITISADAVEVAGLFFKGVEGGNIIDLTGTRWSPHIHDCFFGMSATASSANYGIYASGACSHFSFHDNYFTNYSPGLMTGTDNDIAAFIYAGTNASTRGLIRNNIMHTGGNTAVAAAISCAGYGCFIIGNYLWEDVAFGGTQAGTLTLGISTSADCLVADNRVGITTAADAVQGGTADASYVVNYEGSSGGTLSTG
jgi:hypothetical protein